MSELINSMWIEAKNHLPGYVYAVLYQTYKEKNAVEKFNKLSEFDKHGLECLDRLSDLELRKTFESMEGLCEQLEEKDRLLFLHSFGKEYRIRGFSDFNKYFSSLVFSDGTVCTFDDLCRKIGGEKCSVEFKGGKFTDIDSRNKLQFAIYTAFLNKASFIDFCWGKNKLTWGLEHRIELENLGDQKFGLLGIERLKEVAKSDGALSAQHYSVFPGFIQNSYDIKKVRFFDCDFKIINKTASFYYTEFSDFINKYRCVERLKADVDLLPFFGTKKSKIVFLGLSPDKYEVSAESFFTAQVLEIFKSKYLQPLGLKLDEVLLGNIVPIPIVDSNNKRIPPSDETIKEWKFFSEYHIEDDMLVVALGGSTQKALGDRVDFILPHPKKLLYKNDSGELARKLRSIAKVLDKTEDGAVCYIKNSSELADAHIGGLGSKDEVSVSVSITKAFPEKQIVYGVVSDPYGKEGPDLDAHGDWIPPFDVEAMSHKFMEKSRKIKIQHSKKSKSFIVESFIETYPTPKDYKNAMENKDHTITKRKFGSDFIHSGSWVMGVKLTDSDWKLYKEGKITAFSIGGVGRRAPLDFKILPKVKIVELKEAR